MTRLGKDLLNPSELEERTCSNIRQGQLRKSFQPYSVVQEEPSETPFNDSEESLDIPPLSQVSVPVSTSDPISEISPPPSPRHSDRSNKRTH